MALRKNHLELLELKNMLKKTEIFLEESRLGFTDTDENTSKFFKNSIFLILLKLRIFIVNNF